MPDDSDDRVELTDPRAIRAIAHPARLLIIDAMYDRGLLLTATEAAELAGTTPSAMSYHLRALEKYGIVKRAPSTGDARERPWTRTARHLSLRPSAAGTTAGAAATEAVISVMMDVDRAKLMAATERIALGRERLPLDVASSFSHTVLAVTPEEAVELMKTLAEVIEPLRVENREDAPEGAGWLTLATYAFPDPDHAGGASPGDERS